MWIEEFETYDEVRLARLENCRNASAMLPENNVDPEVDAYIYLYYIWVLYYRMQYK